MNISYRWLKTLAPGLTDSPQEVADRLAMYGAPVDELVSIGAEISDIVVARVLSVRRHPNADRLSLCEVDAGTGETLQVVCGAPNVREGGVYPFAPVGARLPGGITIRKAKLRGEVSEGMLCSARELGLGHDHSGLLELHDPYEPGVPFTEALGLDDVRIVVDVTPNRPDLLSHLGVARELAPGGVEGVRLDPLGPDVDVSFRVDGKSANAAGVQVTIEDPRGCLRYMGAIIRGVEVGPSPDWLAARLRAIGLRPINNVVDATNYILHELGQPLHAFDLDRLGGGEIRVRRARPGELIRTLDGEERVLSEDMVVIADATDRVAVAGVMGGEDSEVTSETRNVFLECALFDPKITRRTRRALGMSTDASYRYERGVDPEGMELAVRRALSLIVSLASGTVEPEGADVLPEPIETPVVGIRPVRASHVLGIEIRAEEVRDLLAPLGFEAVGGGSEELRFRVPGYRRYDVEREADLIEEVARRYGYDRFPDTLRAYRPSAVPEDPMVGLERRLRGLFVARGFLEARSAAFAPEAEGDVALLNPLSSEESRLRRAIAPGLVHHVEHNFAHAVRNVRLFEIGTVFFPPEEPGGVPREATRVAAVFTGSRAPLHWSGAPEAFDIWDLRSILEEVARELGLGEGAIEPGGVDDALYVAPLSYRAVDPAGAVVGWGGQVNEQFIDAPAWAEAVWALEFTLTPSMAAPERPRYAALPQYPAIERDVALLVPESVPAARVESVVREAGGALLETVFPFDLYQGKGIAEGLRSLAYRLRFRSTERTLTDAEVDAELGRVLERLREELGVERRG